MSEFGPTAIKSFMHRQIELGHPYTVMREQYRMHPHISYMVNKLIYGGLLIDNPSTIGRADGFQPSMESVIWRFCRQTTSVMSRQQSRAIHRKRRAFEIWPSSMVWWKT